MATAITSVLGVVFILLGVWLYQHPTRSSSALGILNPRNTTIRKARSGVFLFFIFFGCLISSAAIWGLLLPDAPGGLLPLATAAIGTAILWIAFLQPTSRVEHNEPGKSNPEPVLRPGWKRKLAIWVCVIAALVFVVIVLLGTSTPSKIAFGAAQNDPAVTKKPGVPVKRGLFTSGEIDFGSNGKADLEIPISGPKGQATLHAVERKVKGVWTIETLEVSFEGSDEKSDILKRDPQRSQN